jgi:hypothetical protein
MAGQKAEPAHDGAAADQRIQTLLTDRANICRPDAGNSIASIMGDSEEDLAVSIPESKLVRPSQVRPDG